LRGRSVKNKVQIVGDENITPDPGVVPAVADDKGQALRVDYLLKRIDHTLQFTFTITKLMYLVNGAGLAFIYFAFNKDTRLGGPSTIGFIIALTLSALNVIHANFVYNQHMWYRVDSSALDKETGCDTTQRDRAYKTEREASWRTKLSPIKSAHGTFWWFHMFTALALFVLGLVLLKQEPPPVTAETETNKTSVKVTGASLKVTAP